MASFRKSLKRLGRKTAKIHVKVGRVLTPVVAAGASFIGGPVAGAAVTAAGAEASRYFRATQARHEGQRDRARALGRGERKRVAIYGGIATGAGALGSGLTTALQGGTLGQSLSAGLFGQGGSSILGNTQTLFASKTQQALNAGVGPFGNLNPAVSGTQLPGNVPGLVTQSQLEAALAGGTTTLEAAAAGGGSTDTAGTMAFGVPSGRGQNTPGRLRDPNVESAPVA